MARKHVMLGYVHPLFSSNPAPFARMLCCFEEIYHEVSLDWGNSLHSTGFSGLLLKKGNSRAYQALKGRQGVVEVSPQPCRRGPYCFPPQGWQIAANLGLQKLFTPMSWRVIFCCLPVTVFWDRSSTQLSSELNYVINPTQSCHCHDCGFRTVDDTGL